MNIRQLRQIVRVAESGNLTAVAEELHISQPALTRSIRSAEAELGLQLFERRNRRLNLNQNGVYFVRRARAILAEWYRCTEDLEMLKSGTGEVLSINGSPLTAARLFPEAISRLNERHGAPVHIDVGDPNMPLPEQLAGLQQGRYDFIVSIIDRPAESDGLRRQTLFVPELKVVCREHHPVLDEAKPTMGSLRRYPWIMPPKGTKPRVLIDDEFRKRNVRPPIYPLEMIARSMIIPTLRRSDYLTILPYHPVCEEDDWATLGFVNIELDQTSWPIGIISRYVSLESQVEEAFRRILSEIVNEQATASHEPA